MADEQAAGTRTDVCCGDRIDGTKGKPLVAACQLCPKSPTYWQRDVPEAERGMRGLN